MKLLKNGNKSLFRMNNKRKIILESIITTLNSKIDNIDVDGFGRLTIENNSKLSSEEKSKKLLSLDKELENLYLYHDVLEIVLFHTKHYMLKFHVKIERPWKTEWDIPLADFNEAINGTIEVLKGYQESCNSIFGDEDKNKRNSKYDKKIEFLEELKSFRNKQFN